MFILHITYDKISPIIGYVIAKLYIMTYNYILISISLYTLTEYILQLVKKQVSDPSLPLTPSSACKRF